MLKARLWVLSVGLLASCQALIGYEEKDFVRGGGDGDGDLGGQGGMGPESGGSSGEGSGGREGSGGSNLGGETGTGGRASGGNGSGGGGTGGDGTGGEGTGGITEPAFLPSSCVDLPEQCGGGSDPCCGVVRVPAGQGTRGRTDESGLDHEPAHTVGVSAFYIDQFEVTVGRFGAFSADYEDWRAAGNPMAGAGAHPAAPGSGWRSAWDAELPSNLPPGACHTAWSTAHYGTEIQPMNCLSWYEAYAFCIWDGGRLPTEAEWEYVASGQGSDRSLPWGGGTAVAGLNASFDCFVSGGCDTPDKSVDDFVTVGSLPDGFGIGGVAEMAGNVGEWVRDAYSVTEYYENRDGCTDCLRLIGDDTPGQRVLRGGNIVSPAQEIRTYIRFPLDPSDHYPVAGVRCAYDGD